MEIKKAIIPAAGLGTRVLPASKAVPKEMLNIVDKPAIQYIVEEAFAAGIEDVLIITNRGKGVIEDHFDHAIELSTNWQPTQTRRICTEMCCNALKWAIFILSAKRRPRVWVMRCCAPRTL